MTEWRLIFDSSHGAAENMAIDEAILRACVGGSVPPTVRLYSWDRPSISLGCHQPVRLAGDLEAENPGRRGRDFDIEYCRSEGIEVVRRISGGRAVIHGTDVTFSIALRESDLPSGCGSVIASHQWLMGGIVAGLQKLGIGAEIGPEKANISARNAPADCFAHVAACDVRVGQGKVVGSAQVRKFGGLLEQGSIPYSAPAFDTARVFGRKTDAGDGPIEGLAYSVIAEAIADGFREYLDDPVRIGELTRDEIAASTDLAKEKYATEDWTLRQMR